MTGPSRSLRSSRALRVFALVLSVWLWALPQVMYSKVIIDLFMEQGTCPLPIIEEEEVKHAINVNRPTSASSHPELQVPGLVRGRSPFCRSACCMARFRCLRRGGACVAA